MAHNLYKNRMMYYGEKPWHSLGTKLNNPATSKEAIQASGLDYEVIQEPVKYNGKEVEGKFFNINKETDDVLAIVGGRYEVVQNIRAFDFFDDVVGTKEAMYHTAGALGKGERIWLLAKLPSNILIKKDDVVEKYLCLTNSHDGTSALRVFFTPIRVICQNTLSVAIQKKSNCISIRHTENLGDRVKEARKILGLSLDFYNEVEFDFKAMADTRINGLDRNNLLETLLDINKNDDTAVSTRKQNIMNQMINLSDNGKGNAPYRGSAWAIYNGIAEYVDHYATVSGYKTDPTRRTQNILFGRGANMKERAFELVMAHVKK